MEQCHQHVESNINNSEAVGLRVLRRKDIRLRPDRTGGEERVRVGVQRGSGSDTHPDSLP